MPGRMDRSAWKFRGVSDLTESGHAIVNTDVPDLSAAVRFYEGGIGRWKEALPVSGYGCGVIRRLNDGVSDRQSTEFASVLKI